MSLVCFVKNIQSIFYLCWKETKNYSVEKIVFCTEWAQSFWFWYLSKQPVIVNQFWLYLLLLTFWLKQKALQQSAKFRDTVFVPVGSFDCSELRLPSESATF